MKFKRLLKESSMDMLKTKEWLDKMGIENYTINDDGTVDVDGGVWISNKGLSEIPIQFGVISGSFHCDENDLISLQGCPREVGGDFNCSDNKLTSLDGGPVTVGGNYRCYNNLLKTVDGLAKYIKGDLFINVKNFPSSEIKRIDNISLIANKISNENRGLISSRNLLRKRLIRIQKELNKLTGESEL